MPLSSMASSIYFTAASPMDSMVLSHSTAGLMDATPNTLEISWMISCLFSAPSARTKIRPSCLLTLMPSNFFKSFLIRSTSIRSKYGLFMPFRATSPHLTIKICSFFVSIRQSSPLSSILQASLCAFLPFLQSPLCGFSCKARSAATGNFPACGNASLPPSLCPRRSPFHRFH